MEHSMSDTIKNPQPENGHPESAKLSRFSPGPHNGSAIGSRRINAVAQGSVNLSPDVSRVLGGVAGGCGCADISPNVAPIGVAAGPLPERTLNSAFALGDRQSDAVAETPRPVAARHENPSSNSVVGATGLSLTNERQYAIVPIDLWTRILRALRQGRTPIFGTPGGHRKPPEIMAEDFNLGCAALVDDIADAEDRRELVALTAAGILRTICTDEKVQP
jgi:hypothetical protein